MKMFEVIQIIKGYDHIVGYVEGENVEQAILIADEQYGHESYDGRPHRQIIKDGSIDYLDGYSFLNEVK